MGSPITFSGFNHIDFGSILNTIMAAERAPLTALETQTNLAESTGHGVYDARQKLGALESALDTLTDDQGSTHSP